MYANFQKFLGQICQTFPTLSEVEVTQTTKYKLVMSSECPRKIGPSWFGVALFQIWRVWPYGRCLWYDRWRPFILRQEKWWNKSRLVQASMLEVGTNCLGKYQHTDAVEELPHTETPKNAVRRLHCTMCIPSNWRLDPFDAMNVQHSKSELESFLVKLWYWLANHVRKRRLKAEDVVASIVMASIVTRLANRCKMLHNVQTASFYVAFGALCASEVMLIFGD